jgi:predicted anti-sigma-YlaC factor YlaD
VSRNRLDVTSDYQGMECDPFREMLSAQVDGEDMSGERGFAAAHLRICADCRQWLDEATVLTRLIRTRVAAEPVPDLVDAVLAALPGKRLRLPGLIPILPVLLGVLGAVQILLGVAQISAGANATHVHGSGHLWHESAAWNVAVGAGFLWIAVRRGRAVGMVPTLTAFIAVLALLTANDMMVATVDFDRVLSHGFMAVGYVVVLALARMSRNTGTPPEGKLAVPGRRTRLRLLKQPSESEIRGAQARHRDAA